MSWIYNAVVENKFQRWGKLPAQVRRDSCWQATLRDFIFLTAGEECHTRSPPDLLSPSDSYPFARHLSRFALVSFFRRVVFHASSDTNRSPVISPGVLRFEPLGRRGQGFVWTHEKCLISSDFFWGGIYVGILCI